jgi:hypothetical protein
VTRGRLGLLLFAVAAVVVVVLGLTRSTNDSSDDDEGGPRDLAPGEPYLVTTDEKIDVPEDAGCEIVSDTDSPACQVYVVNGQQVAWLVEQDGDDAPVASFLKRTSPTEFTRVLEVDGASVPFSRVNVTIDDLTGDGGVEAIFGYHEGDAMSVDIVDPNGKVISHLDLGNGQVRTGEGKLVTWRREQDGWLREELTFPNGEMTVVSSEHTPGPAEGNL